MVGLAYMCGQALPPTVTVCSHGEDKLVNRVFPASLSPCAYYHVFHPRTIPQNTALAYFASPYPAPEEEFYLGCSSSWGSMEGQTALERLEEK